MLVKDIKDLLKAREIYIADENIYEKNYEHVFATDLMSDALALLKDETEDVLLISGLSNVQSLRTAEVLDLETVLLVRGKPIDTHMAEMAKDLHINLFQTDLTMFQVCGLLYEKGMR